jgi:dTDP-4-amino-4,6-dideoxygalactose transaminase
VTRIYLSPPDVGDLELALLTDALRSNWVAPLGPYVDRFELAVAEYSDVAHAVALSSGTAGLHLALLLAGVGRDDEVLVPTLTFVATANAVTYVGARPVFIDCDPSTWQIDPVLLVEELASRARLGRLPAAVVTVDLYGQCADHNPIVEVCRSYGVAVIEDAAEALGASYHGRPAGSLADYGVFSFNGNKIITTSGGGMLVTDDKSAADQARFLATQARDPSPHYEHSIVGYNYRLSNLLAAVGSAQMRSLDLRVARRRRVNHLYRELLGDLPGLAFMPDADYGQSSCWLTALVLDTDDGAPDPADVLKMLEEDDIEGRPLWKPMHTQPVFRSADRVGGGVSESLFARGLCLPSGSSLSDGDIERVASRVRCAWQGYGRGFGG